MGMDVEGSYGCRWMQMDANGMLLTAHKDTAPCLCSTCAMMCGCLHCNQVRFVMLGSYSIRNDDTVVLN